MAMQVQVSSLAKKMGGRLSSVNGQCAGQPLVIGRKRLPGGIRYGIAKIQTATWKTQDKDDGKVPKGELYFSASAVVDYPLEHNNMKVSGTQTFLQIPLCDVPAKGQRKASTFEDNFNKFRSFMEAFGIKPCRENQQTDPTGMKTEAYWMAAMKSLTDPRRANGPAYIVFSTRDWTPPATLQNPKPDTITMEEWQCPATPDEVEKYVTKFNPAMGVGSESNGQQTSQPPQREQVFEEPPQGIVDPRSLPDDKDDTGNEEVTEDEITSLVAIAMDDPSGETDEGAQATERLEQLAWNAGWTEDDTNADGVTWEMVGDMILNPPPTPDESDSPSSPSIGNKYKFIKRDGNGAKLTYRGREVTPQDVVIASVDVDNKTCTVKTAKDGKDVMDIRTKKPVVVKWEWLE